MLNSAVTSTANLTTGQNPHVKGPKFKQESVEAHITFKKNFFSHFGE